MVDDLSKVQHREYSICTVSIQEDAKQISSQRSTDSVILYAEEGVDDSLRRGVHRAADKRYWDRGTCGGAKEIMSDGCPTTTGQRPLLVSFY